MATDADALRDLADSVRDLAVAQDHARLDREAMRAEGQARGELVVAQVSSHHQLTIAKLDATEKAVDELRRVKAGAPYWLVAVLIAAILSQAAVVLHMYGQLTGADAGAAFDDAAKIVPDIPGLPEAGEGGTTPTEPEPE